MKSEQFPDSVSLSLGWNGGLVERRLRKRFACKSDARQRSFVPAFESLDERCLLSAGFAGFVQTNLISDVPGLAQITDPNLLNPWGIANSPSGPFWFANNISGTSTANNAAIHPVTIPGLAGIGDPTGVAFNGGSGFAVSQGTSTAPSLFLFASEDGAISGWNPHVDAGQAIVAVNNSAEPGEGPIYTGLTLATNSQGAFLFAANFRAGGIDIFDRNFHAVNWTGVFVDRNLPAGYAPFNVQAIGSSIYVTYTLQNDGEYEVGAGTGIVDVFNTWGQFQQRIASQGPLNSPWGVAIAPSNFGPFGNDLLVGNFGDGRINAFDPHSGAYVGTLKDAIGTPIWIQGLWALQFGNNGAAGSSSSLFFTAGIGGESHGLVGSLQPNAAGVVTDWDFDSQQQLLNEIEDNPDGHDAYPLPPARGPTLHESAQPAIQSRIASIYPGDSPFSLAPAFATPIQANNMVAAASTPAAPVLPAAFVSINGQALLSSAEPIAPLAEIAVFSPGNPRQIDPLPGADVMTDLYSQRVLPPSATNSPSAGNPPTFTPQMSPPAGLMHDDSLFTGELQASSLLTESVAATDEPQRRTDDLFRKWIPHAVIVMAVAGFALHLARSNQDQQRTGVLVRIRNLCSRLRTRFSFAKCTTAVRCMTSWKH